jgi:hydrogenase expression/formation protein HypE
VSARGEGVAERERRKLEIIERARAKPARFTDARVTLAHGAGGRATRGLVEGLLVPAFGSATLSELDDAAPVAGADPEVMVTTDSYVVKPIRFPGGSIGGLAVNGTVNDLAVSGARALALTLALVLEEGLEADELRAEIEAIAAAAELAEVEVVAGDAKVVERTKADKMYVCTSGIGRRDRRARLAPSSILPGDRILLSGTIGDHGMAIMLARGEFDLTAEIESDSRSLWPVAEALIEAAGSDLRCMRDPTRGGVASALNELARASGVSMHLSESAVPMRPAVAGAAELLGIDPMHVANEGKLVAFSSPDAADDALDAMRSVPGCEEAAQIGEVSSEAPGMVLVETPLGGRRVMDELVGDPLPRIC